MDYVRRIDDMGGALAAVERGFQAQEIHENAFRIQRDIEAHRKIVVGVNEFVDEEPPPTGLHQHDITVGERRKQQLRAAARRAATPAASTLRCARIEDAARGDENMMPLLIEAVEQLRDAGRDLPRRCARVWGEQRETMALIRADARWPRSVVTELANEHLARCAQSRCGASASPNSLRTNCRMSSGY